MEEARNNNPVSLLAFWSRKCGSTAIEFAVVIWPFLLLMLSIFEVGWYYFVTATTSAATTDAARIIRTGQAQLSDWTSEEFYAEICDVVDTFGHCPEILTVDVATFADFQELANDASDPTCSDAPPGQIDDIPFEPGGENDIVRVRVCVIYTTFNPAIGLSLAEEGTNKRRLTSTIVFRNEPYERNQGL